MSGKYCPKLLAGLGWNEFAGVAGSLALETEKVVCCVTFRTFNVMTYRRQWWSIENLGSNRHHPHDKHIFRFTCTQTLATAQTTPPYWCTFYVFNILWLDGWIYGSMTSSIIKF